jgi:hypothetical protein
MQEVVEVVNKPVLQSKTFDVEKRILDSMTADIEGFLKAKFKLPRHFTNDWHLGVIPISSNYSNDRKNEVEKQAIEAIFKQDGDDFVYRSALPISQETASEFLLRNGKKEYPTEVGFSSTNGTILELNEDKSVKSLTVFHLLPKAPVINCPDGQKWQLARAALYIPNSNKLTSTLTHSLSYVRLP